MESTPIYVGPNSERNAAIVALRDARKQPHEIAALMGISRNIVIGVCYRAGRSKATNQLRGERMPGAVLTDEKVRSARDRYWNNGETIAAIARDLGASSGAISSAIHGHSWKHVR